MKICAHFLLVAVLVNGALFTNIDNLQNENNFNITTRERKKENLITAHTNTTKETTNLKIINDSLITTTENDNANKIKNEIIFTDITNISYETVKETSNYVLGFNVNNNENEVKDPSENFNTKQLEKENDTSTENFSRSTTSPISDLLEKYVSENISTTESIINQENINKSSSSANEVEIKNIITTSTENFTNFESNIITKGLEKNIIERIRATENIITSPTSSNGSVTESISTAKTTKHISENISPPESFTSPETIISNPSPSNEFKTGNIATSTTERTGKNISENISTPEILTKNVENITSNPTPANEFETGNIATTSTTERTEKNISENISTPESFTSSENIISSPTPANEFETGNISTSTTESMENNISENISTPESFTSSETIITSVTSSTKNPNDIITTPSTEIFNYVITTTTELIEESTERTTEKYSATTDHVFYNQGHMTDETTTEGVPTAEVTPTDSTVTEEPSEHCNELTISDLNIVPSEFSLNVTWINNPKPNCKYQYTIKWEDSNKTSNSSTTDQTEYVIKNLYACETYTVSVYNINNEKDIISNSTETMEAILPVENLQHDFNEKENSLLVTWTIAENVQNCHKSTIIQTVIKDLPILLEQPKPNNQIKFIEVNSCNKYMISVKAKSAKKISEEETLNFTEPIMNDPPIFNRDKLEIEDDFVLTKWSFGKIICQPDNFTVTCISQDKIEFDTQGEMDIENKELTANITNIEPYKTYECIGNIENSRGISSSKAIVFKTKSKPPSAPSSIKTTETENKSLLIYWKEPDKWNGNPESYNLRINYLGLNYKLVEGCKEERPPSFSKKLNASDQEFIYDNIIPAAKYKISLSAESDGGLGDEQSENFHSRNDIPEAPVHLKTEILNLNTVSSKYNVSLKVLWETPCKMHGNLTQFSVTLCENEKICTSNSIGPKENKYYNSVFQNLKPQIHYEVKVWAKNGADFDGKIAEKIIESPAGIPNKINEANIVEPNPSITKEPWNSAVVYISNNIFDQSNGDIIYYSIIVGTEYCAENPKFGIYDYKNNTTWPAIQSDNSSCNGNSRAYEATEKQWNPLIRNLNSADLYRYTLGEDANCTLIDCNKPLTPSTKYFVKIRGYTKHGYIDTKLLNLETAPYGDVSVGLIVGLIIGILAIAFVIAAVLFYTKGRLNFKNWSRGSSGSQISPAPLPVPLKKFVSHYEKMIENPGKIKNEFQLLSTISSDVTLSTKTALLPMNKKKNRYINILPYDQTRVKLEVNETNSTDYINASYIKGYTGSNEFIASQGPTEQTCPAFWQMILEQNVTLIIMLTQFVEQGKEKCYRYFPDVKEELIFSNEICVKGLEETLFDTYYSRVFLIKRKDSDIIGKRVTHLQFIQWPDFGVPKELHKILQFCEFVKDMRRNERGLALVHCSAGVGRTGTLIAVDILLQSIKDKRKVDIFGTVLNLRKQRMNMVQSEKQYEFLYKMMYFISNNKITPPSSKDTLLSISESDML